MDIKELCTRAIEYYKTPVRYYHNFQHAELVAIRADDLLTSMDEGEFHPFSTGRIALRLAAIWHDAVYKVGAKDGVNETLSAGALRTAATNLVESEHDMLVIDRACELIQFTTVSNHLRSNEVIDPEEASLLDADLSSLGCVTFNAFLNAQRKVLQEFTLGAKIEREHYFAGSRFLSKLADSREYIYHTTKGRNIYERFARDNIELYNLRVTEGVIERW